MRYSVVVWDFDGTLADTLALAVATFNGLAARHGFLPIDDPAATRGLGMRAFLRRHRVPLLRVPLLMRTYLSQVREQMAAVRLFDGVPELLRGLRADGLRLGVLSSNTAENIGVCLRANGADDLFDFVVGYPRLFGKARALRRLLRREAVEPRRFLYVGDEVRDVEAAHKAGVDAAAVTWGFNAPELLAALRPTFLWSRPEQALADLRADDSHPAS